ATETGMGGGGTERGAGGVPLVSSSAGSGTGGDSAAAAARRWQVLGVTSVAVFMVLLDVTILKISAAVAEMPPARLATGVAITLCFRQIGAVVGIAVLIAVHGSATADDSLSRFHHSWAVVALSGIVSGLIATALGRVRARQVN